MIITATPMRVSLAGGGTDVPAWFNKHGGAVIGFALARYCWLTVRRLPPYFPYRHRFVYSKIELVDRIEAIAHPVIRATLEDYPVADGLEIHHDGDVPARSGLGSSSAFAVGLVNALAHHGHRAPTARELATAAIRIERTLLGEPGGWQDQIFAAHGGLARIDFQANAYERTPVILPPGREAGLVEHLMLLFTGLQRDAVVTEARRTGAIPDRGPELSRLRAMVEDVEAVLTDDRAPLSLLGELLHESWRLKRLSADGVTTPEIDLLYDRARRAGAIGGKLLGAGGGGFMLLVVPPAERDAVRTILGDALEVPVKIDRRGSRVVVYEPNGFHAE